MKILWRIDSLIKLPFINVKLNKKFKSIDKFMDYSKGKIEERKEKLLSLMEGYDLLRKAKNLAYKEKKEKKETSNIMIMRKKMKEKMRDKMNKTVINSERFHSNLKKIKNRFMDKEIKKMSDKKNIINKTFHIIKNKNKSLNKTQSFLRTSKSDFFVTNLKKDNIIEDSSREKKNRNKGRNNFNLKRIKSLMKKINKNYSNLDYTLKNFGKEIYPEKSKSSLYDIFPSSSSYKNLFIKLDKEKIQDSYLKYIKEFGQLKRKYDNMTQIQVNEGMNEMKKIVRMEQLTANLLAYGRSFQRTSDDLFYKEKKRIVEKYPICDKSERNLLKEYQEHKAKSTSFKNIIQKFHMINHMASVNNMLAKRFRKKY